MRILSVDLGDARTGLAICDSAETIATPLCNVTGKNIFRISEEVARIVIEKRAEKVVVGLPINMDGSEGERANKCRKFSEVLQKDVGEE
ncbi:MAG: Holliday junction resolvase RuvX, partial [Oscillospiraceae bacterium]|nr:Holliday junction resolvase RuvX [Oscillospiraceae bacterium]